jgi:hypothetical protein
MPLHSQTSSSVHCRLWCVCHQRNTSPAHSPHDCARARLRARGQLGNGETGEYFVKGNKIAHNFVTAPARITSFVSRDAKSKVTAEHGDVRFAAVASGRNHSLALERAPGKRVFSWGFGEPRPRHAEKCSHSHSSILCVELYCQAVPGLTNERARQARVLIGLW